MLTSMGLCVVAQIGPDRESFGKELVRFIEFSMYLIANVFVTSAIIAFAFTTSSTLPLYASLKGTTQAVTTVKTPRTRSFKILSALSVFVAVLLMLPLILFSARPNDPETVRAFTLLFISLFLLCFSAHIWIIFFFCRHGSAQGDHPHPWHPFHYCHNSTP